MKSIINDEEVSLDQNREIPQIQDTIEEQNFTYSSLSYLQGIVKIQQLDSGDDEQTCDHDKECDQYPYYRCNIHKTD